MITATHFLAFGLGCLAGSAWTCFWRWGAERRRRREVETERHDPWRDVHRLGMRLLRQEAQDAQNKLTAERWLIHRGGRTF